MLTVVIAIFAAFSWLQINMLYQKKSSETFVLISRLIIWCTWKNIITCRRDIYYKILIIRNGLMVTTMQNIWFILFFFSYFFIAVSFSKYLSFLKVFHL